METVFEETPSKEFKNTQYDYSKLNKKAEYDFSVLYEKSNEEMIAQQSKRDQIITLYLAIFSFIVPYALSIKGLDIFSKGLIFLAVAVIGYMFALIIIRYRIYKEAYWLCCQAITNLMSFKHKELDKETVQAVYYQCMRKRAKPYISDIDEKTTLFDKKLFFRKNIFSGETIYFLIHTFITSILAGLSIILLFNFFRYKIFLGAIGAVVVFIILTKKFFKELVMVYAVLWDRQDESFNKTFSKAWFLHFYID